MVIQLLPQIDLPDTAFQQNTEPLTVHAHCICAPAVLSVGTFLTTELSSLRLSIETLAQLVPDPIEALDRSFRC